MPQTQTFTSTVKTPYTDPEYKMPGYTGFMVGMQETFKQGPIPSQVEIAAPGPESFIHTRTAVAPTTTPARDPCNDPNSFKKPQPGNLWPNMQATAAQPLVKPAAMKNTYGDLRIDGFKTSYDKDFRAPFAAHAQLRSPNRNKDLIDSSVSLTPIYQSAYNRVGDKQLRKIIRNMYERLTAKMDNSNTNAFRFRRLFQNYDKDKTGMVHIEDFRNMSETFGMQLDDDSLLALFYVYDPEGTGYLAYHNLVQQLMDDDCWCMYTNEGVDHTQATVNLRALNKNLGALRQKASPVMPDVEKILANLDTEKTGFSSKEDIRGALASLGVNLTETQFSALSAGCEKNAAGAYSTSEFVASLSAGL